MCNYGRTIPVSEATRTALETALTNRIATGEPFYAMDVTNDAKAAGAVGRHRDMAPVVREMFFEGTFDGPFAGYEMIPVSKTDFLGNRETAYLYAKQGTDPAVVKAHAERVVKPAKPMDGSNGDGQILGAAVPAPVLTAGDVDVLAAGSTDAPQGALSALFGFLGLNRPSDPNAN